jgi:thiamine-monophosphate kinase
MDTIIENALIEKLAAAFPRSPQQLNGLRESDAELIALPGSGIVLAMTTDGIVEEIDAGLYADPYLIGWMTVTVNASDLAAVGADPGGILLNQTLTPELDDDFLARLQRGVADACQAYGLFVMGGDVNFADRLRMAATAIGTIDDGEPLTRRGCRAGDRLFASGPLGLGSAFALHQLTGGAATAPAYQPHARLREGRLLRRFASCGMDTSDGVIPTLDELMDLNRIGFVLELEVEQLLHEDAVRAARRAGLHDWLMLAGPHGEFELLFTVPAKQRSAFLQAASGQGWAPLEIGRVTDDRQLSIVMDGDLRQVRSDRVRNLFVETGGNVEAYVAGLLREGMC